MTRGLARGAALSAHRPLRAVHAAFQVFDRDGSGTIAYRDGGSELLRLSSSAADEAAKKMLTSLVWLSSEESSDTRTHRPGTPRSLRRHACVRQIPICTYVSPDCSVFLDCLNKCALSSHFDSSRHTEALNIYVASDLSMTLQNGRLQNLLG